jgi:hypothetical protein
MEILTFENDTVLNRNILFEKMQTLDYDDVISEYLDGIRTQIDLLILWRDIFSCVKSPGRCQKLIEELDEEKLERLAQITKTLGKKDLLNQIQTLLNQSFNWDPPHCNCEKAALLVDAIAKIEPQKREQIATLCSRLTIDLRHFTELLLMLNRGLCDEDYFANLNDAELDTMLKYAKELSTVV